MHTKQGLAPVVDFPRLPWRRLIQALIGGYLLAAITAAAASTVYLSLGFLFDSGTLDGSALLALVTIALVGALRFILPLVLLLSPLAIALAILTRVTLPIALLVGAAFGAIVGWPAVYWLLPAPGLHAPMFAAALPSGAIFVWPLWRAIHRPQEPPVPRSIWIGVATLLLLLAAAPAIAAEPPKCADEVVLHHLKQAYAVSQMIDGSKRRWKSAEDVRETGLRQPPPNVNRLAPSPDHFNLSRYCEARILFEDGTGDSAYFRIDGRKEPEAADFNFDPCFLGYDVSKNGCADQRLPPEPPNIPGKPQ